MAPTADFTVNSDPLGTNYSPFASTIAVLPDGTALVAWVRQTGQWSTESEIYARWVRPAGTVVGVDFLVNSTTSEFQWRPVATVTAEGKVFLAWESGDGGDGDGVGLRGVVLDPMDQTSGSDFLVNLGRMKSDIEKQASDHAALAARDMALLTRDVLLSKGEIMKQSSDNTASLQLEALKNKDALSGQLHCTYEKLSALNTDRIRDNLDDYRAEYTGMKYGDFHRGHIHNNLHSHMGREGFGREGFGREGR